MRLPFPLTRPTTIGAALLLPALLAAGCAGQDAPADAGGRDLTVTNCGAEVHVDGTPQRVVMLKPSPVTFLHQLGVMDHVVARAGAYPPGYYDAETRAALEEVPLLTDELDSSGHLQISKETVIAEEPDLVLGEIDNLSRSSLEEVGIPLIEAPALCASGADTDPSFGDVYAQMELFGKVFDVPDAARRANAELKERVEAVEPVGRGRTAAVLYPTVGGGTTYAYGNSSMAQPQLEAAGFENVFDDTDERVFEVTLEELLGRDPDVLILLYSAGDPTDVTQAITDLPGAGKITAIRNGDVMTQLFNFTEPATPLSVTGLERITERFGGGS